MVASIGGSMEQGIASDKSSLEEAILTSIANTDYQAIGTVDLSTHEVTYHFVTEARGDDVTLADGSFEERAEALYNNTRSSYERKRLKENLSIPHILAVLETEPTCTVSFQISGRHEQLIYRYLDQTRSQLLFTRRDVTEAVRERDDTARTIREALEAAESANVAKTQFLSRISHDIRTPIGAILNLCDFALEDIDDRERLLADLQRIQTSGRFLLSLINDVLDISRVDSGKIELVLEPYDYQDFMAEMTNIMEPMCAEKNITFEVDARHENVRSVLADKVRLRQVTLNILSNAVKFTPAGGTVRYTSDAHLTEEGRVAFEMRIADTGIGMSQEFLQHIYDEFSQEYDNPLRERTTSGTGLGLPIVKKLLDVMGGTIDVQSERGKGTEVTVRLTFDIAEERPEPQEQEPEQDVPAEQPTAAEQTEPTVHAPVHILLAEDNIINAEIAKRIFEEMGVDVDHAPNGAEALKMFCASDPGQYQAIFMDIQMPEMNGYEATRAIRASSHPEATAIPIIAMTADAFAEAEQQAYESGMSNYITKPLSVEQIHGIIQSVTRS